MRCFRSARRFGAVGSSPDFSKVFHAMVLLGLCRENFFSSLTLVVGLKRSFVSE